MNPAEYNADLDPLLREAASAYRHHDDETFAALLEDAIAMAPYRQDLAFDLANHRIQTGETEQAIGIFRELAGEYPRDIDVLTYLSHWLRYSGETGEAEKVRLKIAELRESRADDVGKIWRVLDQRLSQPVTDTLPVLDESVGMPGIVALGFLLAADGSMQPPLLARLEKALETADAFPDAPIIVTGGVPRSGLVEAESMHEWLVKHGVRDERIHEEGYARDVVENIVYSRPILDRLGVGAAIIVTSAIDVRRAGAAMEICARVNGSAFVVPDAVAAHSPEIAQPKKGQDEKLKLYRDGLRAYGLPMMRTYPHLIEL